MWFSRCSSCRPRPLAPARPLKLLAWLVRVMRRLTNGVSVCGPGSGGPPDTGHSIGLTGIGRTPGRCRARRTAGAGQRPRFTPMNRRSASRPAISGQRTAASKSVLTAKPPGMGRRGRRGAHSPASPRGSFVYGHGPQLASSSRKSRIPTFPSPSKSGGPPGSVPQAASRANRSLIPTASEPSRSHGQGDP